MPRAVDRGVPDIDKNPNIFGTDYTNPLGQITDAAAEATEAIRAGILAWIKDVIGIDLTGPIEFINWLSDQIGVALFDLADTLLTLLTPVIDAVEDILEMIFKLTGIDLRSPDGFLNWLGGLIGVDLRNLKTVLDGIGNAVGQTIEDILDGIKALLGLDLRALANLNPIQLLTDLAANVSQLMTWFNDVGTQIAAAVSAALDNVVAKIKDLTGLDLSALANLNPVALLTQIVESFSGLTMGAGAIVNYISSAISTAITNLLNGTALRDQVNALVNAANAAFQTAAQVAASIQTAITNLLNGTDLQNRVNTLVNAATAAFQTAAQVSAAIQTAITNFTNGAFKTLQDLVQSIIDGIAGVWAGAAVAGKPVADLVAAISGILGIGNAASAAAAQANMGVSAILAQQAGGYADEFDYTMNADLAVASSSAWMRKNTAINDTYGPNGSGVLTGRVSGNAQGPVQYVQVTKPLTSADMKVTAVLARNPWWDLMTKSSWYLLVQASATMGDRTCYGVEIMDTTCQFFSLNAGGTQTNIGAAKAIPGNAIGLPYSLQIKGTTMTLTRNGIVAATQAVSAPLAGRCVGFGGYKPAYIHATDNPLAHFAGISWQTA